MDNGLKIQQGFTLGKICRDLTVLQEFQEKVYFLLQKCAFQILCNTNKILLMSSASCFWIWTLLSDLSISINTMKIFLLQCIYFNKQLIWCLSCLLSTNSSPVSFNKHASALLVNLKNLN